MFSTVSVKAEKSYFFLSVPLNFPSRIGPLTFTKRAALSFPEESELAALQLPTCVTERHPLGLKSFCLRRVPWWLSVSGRILFLLMLFERDSLLCAQVAFLPCLPHLCGPGFLPPFPTYGCQLGVGAV